MPNPIRIWMKAKARVGDHGVVVDDGGVPVMVRATAEGLPSAMPLSIPLKPWEPAVNMKGWSCRTPSRSQTDARASCNIRRPSGGRQGISCREAPVPASRPSIELTVAFMTDGPRPVDAVGSEAAHPAPLPPLLQLVV